MVVLVIAILMAVALPTFLGAREAAWDRASQSNVRNAHTSQMVHYADGSTFTEDPDVLAEIDPSLDYINTSASDLVAGTGIYVEVQSSGPSRPDDIVFLAGRSGTGRCYWLRTIGDENHPRFAENDCSTTPPAAAFGDRWDR